MGLYRCDWIVAATNDRHHCAVTVAFPCNAQLLRIGSKALVGSQKQNQGRAKADEAQQQKEVQQKELRRDVDAMAAREAEGEVEDGFSSDGEWIVEPAQTL